MKAHVARIKRGRGDGLCGLATCHLRRLATRGAIRNPGH
jgi:hypothetical protein